MKTLSTVFLILLLFTGCKEEPKHVEHPRPEIKGVKTKKVLAREIVRYYETSATTVSSSIVRVSPKIMGVIEDLKVKEGDTVKKGQLLFRIYSPELQAKIEQAEEAIKEAEKAVEMARKKAQLMERTFSRYRALFQEKVVTEQEFDEIRTKRDISEIEVKRAEKALERARAALNEAKTYGSYRVVRAPISGVITEKMMDEGTMAMPGAPVLTIEVPHYRVEASVDERFLKTLRVGERVSVIIPSLGLTLQRPITKIIPQVDPGTKTFVVKIDLGNRKNIKSGLYSVIRIREGSRKVLLVPLNALIVRGEIKALYVVDEKGIVTLRLVKTGKRIDDTIEVLSGLDEGERIVVSGVEHVIDGGIIREE